MKKHVKNNVYWVGYLDWDMQKFHGDDYTIHSGSSQNAYLIQEEKTVLIDSVWAPHQFDFVEDLKSEIDLKKIDCIVVNHGENDHSGALPALMDLIPDTPIYCTENAIKSLEGQYGKRGWNFHVVHTGDSLEIGNGKKLIFVEMFFLHWPDSMATYMTGDNILFSNDAFGQHYALEEMFADKADQSRLWDEAMRYYANIVCPFSSLVTKKVNEISALNLPIDMIAPSHGAIWREDPLQIVKAYAKWADAYQEDQVTIVYGTQWHGTEKLANAIASEVNKQSPDTRVKVYNVDHTNKDDIILDVFKSKAIAVGSPTILHGILASVEGFLYYLKSLQMKGKNAAAFGCYGWSGEGNDVIKGFLNDAGFEVVTEGVKSCWNPEDDTYAKIPALVSAMLGKDESAKEIKASEEQTQNVNSADADDDSDPTSRWQCPCGYIYDPQLGDPDRGVEPGTPWDEVPPDWRCPVCNLPKSAFKRID